MVVASVALWSHGTVEGGGAVDPRLRFDDSLRPADLLRSGPSGAPASTTTPETGTTTSAGAVVAGTSAQTIDGFGASGAWWPNDLVQFSSPARQQVASWLFGSRGIALSIYRYNIGGGGVGDVNRASPTFLVRPGTYDWTRDPGGQLFLRDAARARVPTLVGFANTAPGAWTTNGKACGGQLKPGDEDAYAGYLADVARHLHDALDATLRYVSPMNEPDSSFDGCYQEGMKVPTAQRSTLVKALAGALAAKAPYSGVMADETSHVDTFVGEGRNWLAPPGTSAAVNVLATHDYDFAANSTLQDAGNLAASVGKPLWMTEICCNHGMKFARGFDPTMTGAIWMANAIAQNLTQASATGFVWWTALSPTLGCDPRSSGCPTSRNDSGWDDGLVYYDGNFRTDHNQGLYPTKRLWVLGNFSRFVRPGAVRHPVSGVPRSFRVLAFRSSGSWIVVVVNEDAPGSGPGRLPITLPDDGATLGAPAAYATNGWKDLEAAATPTLSGHTLSISVPPRSVTTYVIPATGG
ncbi:MAG TPA: glycoside hydrolase [Actinomycetota bacterium]